MSARRFASGVALAAASAALSIAAAELALHAAGLPPGPAPVYMRPSAELGYEPFAGARVASYGREEYVGVDGFRGPVPGAAKAPGTFRIAAIGDSVVHSLHVPEPASWPHLLEHELRASGRSVEVLNAGVEGYVSWQTLRRFEMRVARYAPDLVLFHAGWNDLVYSSLPTWTPHMDATRIDEAYARTEDEKHPVRRFLARRSRIFRFARAVRARSTYRRLARELIRARREPSGIPFNEEALADFTANLAAARESIAARGARMALLVWPTLVSPELFEDPRLHDRLVPFYQLVPLSAEELLAWQRRYVEAMRSFAAAHPDVLLVDLDAALAGVRGEERLALFLDQAHYTERGNARVAEAVAAALKDLR